MPNPVIANETDDVASRKRMQTKATLHRNGLLITETFSKSFHPSEGLRGHVLVVVLDGAGRAIWVSQDHKCTTRCSRLDFACASSGTDAFTEQFPEVVGQFAAGLDIVHSDEGLGDFRNKTIQAIKTTEEIAQEIKQVRNHL
jgi:hypothetical protein